MNLIQQAERDLRWLVNCPSLLESPASLDLPDPFLNEGRLDWSPVLRFHESKASYRVGYYVESLIQVWLSATPGIERIQHGIQVRKEKVTLGELDFLFRKNGELYHLEVALKYYLYSPERTVKGSHFIGPNARDTFERKRDRLIRKQLPFGLSYDPDIHTSRHLVKGMIFYPEGVSGAGEIPENLNPDHARGTWQFAGESAGEPIRFLEKPFWLDGRHRAVKETGLPPGHPCLLYREETGHHFLVPDTWPEEPAT